MATFEICIDHSKLRPTHEYSSQSEVYSEASGDIPIYTNTEAHTAILRVARCRGSGGDVNVSNRLN